MSSSDKQGWGFTHFGCGCGALDSIFTLGSVDTFCFMVDGALHLCLVEAIDNGVFTLRYIN